MLEIDEDSAVRARQDFLTLNYFIVKGEPKLFGMHVETLHFFREVSFVFEVLNVVWRWILIELLGIII